MKVKWSSSEVSRRDFIKGTTAGLAAVSLQVPTAAAAQTVSGGTGIKPVGTSRLLYVTSDDDETINVYDVADGHKLVRVIPWQAPWAEAVGNPKQNRTGLKANRSVGGVCAWPATNRLWVTHTEAAFISCYDFVTGKAIYHINSNTQLGQAKPDRPALTADGRALYMPFNWLVDQEPYKNWDKHVNFVLDPSDGKKIAEISRPGRPHNNWAGEGGKYMYLGGRSDPTLVITDQKTHKVVKTMEFGSPVRQMVTSPAEEWVYCTCTRTTGLAFGNIRTGEVMPDLLVKAPRERTRHWKASVSGGGNGQLPHGDHPWSHGIGMRPGGSEEVWLWDDEWGVMHVFDTKSNPGKPKLIRQVAMYDKIDEPFMLEDHFRWTSFSIDGKYCYPSGGHVLDCETGKMTSMKIARSEKLLEIEFRDGKAVRCTGQQGGVYGQVRS